MRHWTLFVRTQNSYIIVLLRKKWEDFPNFNLIVFSSFVWHLIDDTQAYESFSRALCLCFSTIGVSSQFIPTVEDKFTLKSIPKLLERLKMLEKITWCCLMSSWLQSNLTTNHKAYNHSLVCPNTSPRRRLECNHGAFGCSVNI